MLGPEAPLIALGAGLGIFAIRSLRRDTPPEAQAVMAAAGSIAAMSMLFNSPIIAAVLLIEALGLDREKLPLVLLPGLLAAGIGSLVSIGMGSLSGLSTSAYALGALSLPSFAQPALADFLWTIPLAVAVAVLTFAVLRLGLLTHGVFRRRPLLAGPAIAVLVALLAVAFHQASGRGIDEVLFSGQDGLPGLVTTPAPGRSRRCCCSSSSRAWPGGCRSAASAVARPSRRSSSAPPPGSSPRTCRAST